MKIPFTEDEFEIWFDDQIREAKAEAWDEGCDSGKFDAEQECYPNYSGIETQNPYEKENK